MKVLYKKIPTRTLGVEFQYRSETEKKWKNGKVTEVEIAKSNAQCVNCLIEEKITREYGQEIGIEDIT